MKSALYPGSFDPLHNGHIEILKKALKIFDHITIAVSVNISKNRKNSVDNSVILIKEQLKEFKNVDVLPNENELTIDFAKKLNIKFIVRGLRDVNDLEYEYKIFDINKSLDKEIETVYFFADSVDRKLSSSLMEEVEYFKNKKK